MKKEKVSPVRTRFILTLIDDVTLTVNESQIFFSCFSDIYNLYLFASLVLQWVLI